MTWDPSLNIAGAPSASRSSSREERLPERTVIPNVGIESVGRLRHAGNSLQVGEAEDVLNDLEWNGFEGTGHGG